MNFKNNIIKYLSNIFIGLLLITIVFIVISCGNNKKTELITSNISTQSEIHTHIFEIIKEITPTLDNYGYKVNKCKICNFTEIIDIYKPIDDSYLQPHYLSDDVLEGRSNWLFLIGNGDFPYYLAENILTEKEMANYNTQLKRFVRICNEKGKQVAFLIIPNKSQIYSEYMPTLHVKDNYKRTKRYVDYLNNNSDININYIFDELNYAKIFNQVYCKYDSHLNDFGSFVAANALNKMLGQNTFDLNYYDLQEKECTGGDLIGLAKLDVLSFKKDKDCIIDYKPDIEVTYRNATDPVQAGIYKTKSTSENKKNMVYIGDSFRVRLIPYLEKDFSNATFIHLFNIEQIESEIEKSDLIIIELIERYDYLLSNISDRILSIINRP